MKQKEKVERGGEKWRRVAKKMAKPTSWQMSASFCTAESGVGGAGTRDGRGSSNTRQRETGMAGWA